MFTHAREAMCAPLRPDDSLLEVCCGEYTMLTSSSTMKESSMKTSKNSRIGKDGGS